jgi:chromosome segregation ATPase
MNFNHDPFQEPTNKQTSTIKASLASQDDQLEALHATLTQAKHQSDHINAELHVHTDLLGQLNGRLEDTSSAFEEATRRVRKLYGELTEKRFGWTASVLIAFLTILLIYLILT